MEELMTPREWFKRNGYDDNDPDMLKALRFFATHEDKINKEVAKIIHDGLEAGDFTMLDLEKMVNDVLRKTKEE